MKRMVVRQVGGKRAALLPAGLAVMVGFAALGTVAHAGEAEQQLTIKPLADFRLRYENVDQEPFVEEAEALTLRARLGFEAGKVWDTTLLAEGDFLWPLVTDYNSTTNGKTAYPVVADPEAYELNRLQLTNTSLPGTTLTLGRQRILLDDHRFVGNVGWRQNEQTYDAFRLVNKSIPKLTIDLTYADQVNRIFGPDGLPGANDGRFTGDIVLANLAYQTPVGKLTGFGYFMEFDQPAAVGNSTSTLGLRFQGDKAVGKGKIAYAASWATQKDSGDNPLDFSNDYYLAELSGTITAYTFGAGYEVLQGDGAKGFTTPLATLHKFQGWGDKFLGTPASGLEDLYLSFAYSRKAVGFLETIGLNVVWHDFQSEVGSTDLGSELDVQLQGKYKKFTGILKYADYNAKSGTPASLRDTSKLWVELDFTW